MTNIQAEIGENHVQHANEREVIQVHSDLAISKALLTTL